MKKIIILLGIIIWGVSSYAQNVGTLPVVTSTGDTTKVLIVGSTSVERISLNNLVQSATINADSLGGVSSVSFLQVGDNVTELDGTAWRVFYVDGSGNVQEVALGADGTYLRSNGAALAPSFTTPSGSGDALTTDGLDQFAATTSLELAGVISNETGSGSLVFGTSPTFTTQITIGSGVITATEAGYIDPTSSIQTQLDSKLNASDSVSFIAGANITLTESVTGDSLTIASTATGDVSLSDSTVVFATPTQLSDSLTAKAHMLTDSELFYSYGYGSNVVADSAIADSGRVYGVKSIYVDSIDFVAAVPMLSQGDSIVVRVMYNDTAFVNGIPLDTFNLGSSIAPIDITDWPTLPNGQKVWVECFTAIPTLRPTILVLELWAILKRD